MVLDRGACADCPGACAVIIKAAAAGVEKEGGPRRESSLSLPVKNDGYSNVSVPAVVGNYIYCFEPV